MSVARALVALHVVLVGCTDSRHPMLFTAEIVVPARPVAAQIEGVDVLLAESSVQIEHEYPSYRTLENSADTFSVLIDLADGQRIRGEIVPGVCTTSCIYPECPTRDELSLEHLQFVASGDFTYLDYDCYHCEGGGKIRPACR